MYTPQVWSDDFFEAASRRHRPVAVHRRGCARCILGDLHRIYEKVAMMDESLAKSENKKMDVVYSSNKL